MVFYMLVLKLLRKKIIYFNSWPYWDGTHFVFKPNFLKKKLWTFFLKGVPSVTVTVTAQKNLTALGSKVTFIPHSVDTSCFVPSLERNKKRPFRILTVGRLNKEKGIQDVLRLAQEFPLYEFWFVGEGPLAPTLLSATPNVIYKGYVKDRFLLSQIYQQCDLFVLNSYATSTWEELFGIVLLEAMSCGLAVIATDCVGPQEIISLEKSDLLIPQKDLLLVV